jgi:hypothetical protein
MATTGTGTPSTNEPKEGQAGADMAAGGSLPRDGRGMGATAGMGSTARVEGAQEAQGESHQERGMAQRAILLRQAEEAAARLTELMGELAEAGASSPPDETGLEDQLKAAAAVLQMTGSKGQPEPVLGSAVQAVAVGVLRAEKSETESRWQCKVLTCAESYHPLVACLQFLLMSAEERMDLAATAGLCRGCLTPGHGVAVRTCLFREELNGLCAKPKCRRAHHQLLHLEGKPDPRPLHRSGRDTAASNQHRAQMVVTMMHLAHQPPVQAGDAADKDDGREALRLR